MSIALLFPGQGSQQVGMGKDLFEGSPAARSVFEQADEALGMPLSRLCFEGPESELTLTANAQPALLTTSIAAWACARERLGLLRPAVALGHSLGEFSALVAAGALRFTDAVRLVRLRGEAMQDAVAPGVGAMAAIVGLDADALQVLCEEAGQGELVAPANENGGGQIVVAGHAGAVERLCALAKSRKARAIPLNVSAPFHCALMQPAAERLSAALADVAIAPLAFAVVANVTGEPNSDRACVADLLVRQVTGRVRWEASVLRAAALGVRVGIELGHGNRLAGMVKRIAPEIRVVSCGSPAQCDVLNGLGDDA